MRRITRLVLGALLAGSLLLAACANCRSGPALVRALAVDAGGSLWAAGDRGAVRWDVERGTHREYTVRRGLKSKPVQAVAVAPDGTV